MKFENLYIIDDLISNVKGELLPKEQEYAQNMVSKRFLEFSAGRILAKLALAKLDVYNFPLLQNKDRTVAWPSHITGSISHNHTYCMVAICKKSDYKSVGVDVEDISRVQSNIWSRICTKNELKCVNDMMPSLRSQYAAIIFSAKEAFYKCQYPLTKMYVNFHDVEIEIDKENNRFFIVPLKLPVNFPQITDFIGYYELHSEFVKTLCYIKD